VSLTLKLEIRLTFHRKGQQQEQSCESVEKCPTLIFSSLFDNERKSLDLLAYNTFELDTSRYRRRTLIRPTHTA